MGYFPRTNKIHREIEEKVGDNLKLLEDRLKTINWIVFLKSYFSFFGVLLVSIFLLIVVIRLASNIF